MNKLIPTMLIAASCICLNASAGVKDTTNDNPLPPVNVHAELSEDGTQVTVSWECPGSVGESGGFVETSKLTYYIFDAFGSFFDPAIAVTTDTVYTFDYSDMEGQDFKAYQLTAGVNETYYSLAVNTNIVVVGAPDALPYNESFANGKFAHMWAIDPESSYSSSASVAKDGEQGYNSQDSDNGFVIFKPAKANDAYGIMSLKADFSMAENPALDFYYTGTDGFVTVLLSVNGFGFNNIVSYDLGEYPAADWTSAHVDLSFCLPAKYVQVEFLFTSGLKKSAIAIDNISIYDFHEEEGMPAIESHDAPIQIYTIDGLPVKTPSVPGIYLVRQGDKVRKVVF